MKNLVVVALLSLSLSAVVVVVSGQELNYEDDSEPRYNRVESVPEQLAHKSRDFGVSGEAAQERERQQQRADATSAAARECPRECVKEECVSPSECQAG